MSTALRISAVFDGSTVTTLENVVHISAERLFALVVPLAGEIRPWTFAQIGARDWFLQAISIKGVPAGGSASFKLLFPDGNSVVVPLSSSGDQAVASNVLVPQGCLMVVTVLDNVGAPAAAVMELWIYGVNDKNYAELACCHVFTPDSGMGLGGISCDNGATDISTEIAAAGAFVPVGEGNPSTHPVYVVDPVVSDFVLVGATADVQTLDYVGVLPRDVVINPTVVVATGVLGGILVHMRVLKNGVAIAPELVAQTAGLFNSAATLTGELHTRAEPGDSFQIEVANITDDTNILVDFAQLSAGIVK